MTRRPLRVAVVSGSALIGAGLRRMLGSDPTRVVVVGAGTGDLARADVVIYDLAGPSPEAEPLEHLAARVPTIALVPAGAGDLGERAAPNGAHTTVSTSVSTPALFAAVEAVARVTLRPPPTGEEALSARELDILALVGGGLSNVEVGRRLFLSVNTVKSHIRTAYAKLGVHSRSQAVLWALDRDLPGRRDPRPETGATEGGDTSDDL